MHTNKPVFPKFLRQALSSHWEKSMGCYENNANIIGSSCSPLLLPHIKNTQKNAK